MGNGTPCHARHHRPHYHHYDHIPSNSLPHAEQSTPSYSQPPTVVIVRQVPAPYPIQMQVMRFQVASFQSNMSRIQTQMMQPHMHENRQVPVTKLSTKSSMKLGVGVTKNKFSLSATSSLSRDCSLNFSIDAKVPCKVCIRQFVVEQKNSSWDTTGYKEDPRFPQPIAIDFSPGQGQKFPETAFLVDLSRWPPTLLEFGDKMTIPIMVELTEKVNPTYALTYHLKYERKESDYEVKLITTKLHANGQSYELKHVFGLETEQDTEFSECVVCMTAARDTTTIPCKHMSMCKECASVIMSQYEKNCPVCRTPIEKLVQIERDSDILID
mmetsp:Transcript_24424/g.43326  ORF Transcript_24424/g.43326 Transcript_24424/m.43326 type:complete len:326 (-) Transcript_24424:761-1738(-)